jgi:hypothetical protein
LESGRRSGGPSRAFTPLIVEVRGPGRSIENPPQRHRASYPTREVIDEARHHQIEMTSPTILEERDLVATDTTGMTASAQVEEIRPDVLLGQRARGDGSGDIATMTYRKPAAVYEDARAPDGFVVRLAHIASEAADEVDMRSRREPRTM